MQDKNRLINEQDKSLTSPDGFPFKFGITISATSSNKPSLSFKVTGEDPNAPGARTIVYNLNDREHHSYLDFFEKLSEDFGLRVPLNRQPAVKNSFETAYQELLKENLVPNMLFGYGDPCVVRVEETGDKKDVWYYLVVTSNDAPNSFPICRSRDLTDWEFVTFVFPIGSKPAWAADGEFISDYWAPEMHKVGNEFRIYFVARDKKTFELCIGMARSSNPSGPFVADPQPMLKGNMIDPHVLVEDEDNVYLFWKEDNNAVWPGRLVDLLYNNPAFIIKLFSKREDQVTASFVLTLWPWIQALPSMEAFLVKQILIEAVTSDFAGFVNKLETLSETEPSRIQKDIKSLIEVMRTPVYAQKLSPDGSRLVGDKKKIIENDLAWEAHLVEGIWVSKHRNKYYLFYSGNDFSTDQYGIGVAIANSPLGPYKKIPEQILRSTYEWWAPGHPSVAVGPGGKPQLFLHAFFPRRAGYKEFRALLTVPITFDGDQVLLG